MWHEKYKIYFYQGIYAYEAMKYFHFIQFMPFPIIYIHGKYEIWIDISTRCKMKNSEPCKINCSFLNNLSHCSKMRKWIGMIYNISRSTKEHWSLATFSKLFSLSKDGPCKVHVLAHSIKYHVISSIDCVPPFISP